ncbi:chaperone NapD [Dyella halodurans]|uniref:Chaperone NapD n=1 Tax=Dyella halodurans TaxID=1920171 RepID=A0ABV9C2S5_9GAMM|nr:chaperone NapD [Dyella halodurans]
MNDEQHISSLVLLHRHEALPAIKALVEAHAGLEIAAQGDCRCVVLCETNDQRALMDHIDALELLPGVLNVSLIYHHVESLGELDQPMEPGLSS